MRSLKTEKREDWIVGRLSQEMYYLLSKRLLRLELDLHSGDGNCSIYPTVSRLYSASNPGRQAGHVSSSSSVLNPDP